MIIPATKNLIAYRNGVFREAFQVVINGSPIDLSEGEGWEIAMEVRVAAGQPGDPLVAINSLGITPGGSEIIITDAPNGLIELYISNRDIQGCPAQTYPLQYEDASFVHDIVLMEPGGDFNPFYTGTFVVKEGVTRKWQTTL